MFKFDPTFSIDTFIQLLYMTATVAMFWSIRKTDVQGWKKLRIENAHTLVQMFNEHLDQTIEEKGITNRELFHLLVKASATEENQIRHGEICVTSDYFHWVEKVTDDPLCIHFKDLIHTNVVDHFFLPTTIEIAEFIAGQANDNLAETKVILFEIGQYLEHLKHWAEFIETKNKNYHLEWKELKHFMKNKQHRYKFPKRNYFYID